MLAKRAINLLDVCSCSAVIAVSGALAAPMLNAGGGEMNRSGALAKAVLIYVEDNNHRFPLAMSRRANGTWRWPTMHPAPANVVASGDWALPESVASTSTFWANSIRWYARSREDYQDPTQESRSIAGDAFAPGVTPLEVGLTFNGFLHVYSQSAVIEPNLVPVIWAGTGSVSFKGRASSNPVLACRGSADCRFNGSAPPQSDFPGKEFPGGEILAPYVQFPDSTVWSKRLDETTGGGTIAFADGSARFMKWATTLAPAVSKDASKDMFASIEIKNGKQATVFYHATNTPDCSDIRDETVHGENLYPCFFRPDRIK
jgi:hypothetical protein